MILDSSAVVAIFRGEPEATDFALRIELTADVSISAATLVEVAMVLGPERYEALDELLDAAAIRVVPVDHEQAIAARDAAARFGRGSGSKARLNFADCFAYALAATSDQPLLCKGDDFVHTDLELAVRAR